MRDAPPPPAAADLPTGGARADDDAALAAGLRLVLLRLSRRLRAERSDASLTLSQLSALSSLANVGSCSPTALAELERVQPPSMTRIIANLEASGYAERAPHARDRRQAVIAITPAGRAVLEETRRRSTEWLAGALADLAPEERAALADVLPLLGRLLEH